ncbi:MAG: DUF3343 domain-containing protein [Nitrospinae bacterium]|nr:DUF3343 domain-containing protein [Nitrospinota bacterium]MBF0635408.1 DUF3343 domain-containing protein [Nitrospinota bacterium]
MNGSFLAVFESTTETLKAERALKEAGLKPRPVIKPRKLAGSCQMALKLPSGSIAKVRDVSAELRLKLIGFFVQGDDGEWVALG